MIRPVRWCATTKIVCPSPWTRSSFSLPAWCRPVSTTVRWYHAPTGRRIDSIEMSCICRQMLFAASIAYVLLRKARPRRLCDLFCKHSRQLAATIQYSIPSFMKNWCDNAVKNVNFLLGSEFTCRNMPSLRANSAWATKSSSRLKISCNADLLFKLQYFL